jgi:hypothetical protein
MNLFTFLVLLAYAASFSIVLFVVYRIFFPPVIVVEKPITISTGWWPWSITTYNHWPSWYSAGGITQSYGSGKGSYGERCPSGSCSMGGSKRDHFTPPWGGAGRGANAGGFHSSEGANQPTNQ